MSTKKTYANHLKNKMLGKRRFIRPRPVPGEEKIFKGNGYIRYKKLLDLGVPKDEAEELAHSVKKSREIFDGAKKILDDEVRELIDINEGDGPGQINIKEICKFERQRDILRRLLQQGVKLDEAVPLAEEAGENQIPFDKTTAKRFVKEQLRRISSSSEDVKLSGGSCRKRFRKLIVKGINVEKARLLSRDPWETKRAIFALRGIELQPKTPNQIARAHAGDRSRFTYVRPRDDGKQEIIPPRASVTRNETTTRIPPRRSETRNETTTQIPPRRSETRNEIAARPTNNTWPQGDMRPSEMMEQQFIPPNTNYNYTESEELIQQNQTKELALKLLQQLMPELAQEQQDQHLSQGSMVSSARTEPIKLAVISPDFPLTIWPAEMLKGIQKCISQTARMDGIDLSDGCITCSFRPGWIAYTVYDERIAQWFRLRVINLRPYDAYVTVVNESEVPRSELFVAYIPERRDISTEDLLIIIGKQNSNLRTQDWNVTNREQRGSILELNIVVDPFSARMLKQNNYTITYGYLSVSMKPRENVKPPPRNSTVDPSLTRSNRVDYPRRTDDNVDFSRREDAYGQLSGRTDDNVNFSGREDDFAQTSRREDDFSHLLAGGITDALSSRREENYSRPSAREESFARPTAREENYARPYAREDSFARPSVREDSYARPSAREDRYARPSAREENYARSYAREDSYARPSVREDSYARPSVREDSYARPSAREDSYARPSAREERFARPSAREDNYGRPSAREKNYVRPSEREDNYSRPAREENHARSFQRENGNTQFSRRENDYSRFSRMEESINQRGHEKNGNHQNNRNNGSSRNNNWRHF